MGNLRKFKNYLCDIYGKQPPVVLSRKAARFIRKMKRNKYEMIFAGVIVKTPGIALDFSNVWLTRIEQLKLTYQGLKDDVSHYFTPAPINPTLPDLLAAITALSNAQFAVHQNEAGGVGVRDAAWKVALKLAKRIRNYVFDICDDDPEHALEISQEAHLVYFLRKGREKQVPSATSKISCEIELCGHTKKTRVCTDWQICEDPSKESNWLLIKVFPTSAAKTTVKDVISDKDYYTRSCMITKDGPEPWETVIKVKVK